MIFRFVYFHVFQGLFDKKHPQVHDVGFSGTGFNQLIKYLKKMAGIILFQVLIYIQPFPFFFHGAGSRLTHRWD